MYYLLLLLNYAVLSSFNQGDYKIIIVRRLMYKAHEYKHLPYKIFFKYILRVWIL